MDEKAFQELLNSVREGGAILRGEQPPARVFVIADTQRRAPGPDPNPADAPRPEKPTRPQEPGP